jgi:hypothetical protein
MTSRPSIKLRLTKIEVVYFKVFFIKKYIKMKYFI